jgi:ribosomal peptide maturation radical SAM protein 1
MPFSGYRQPSLALGILKSVLRPLASHVAVLDATLIFAEMISPTAYDTIATWPAQDLLGDWVFAHALSPERGQEYRGYEQQVLAGGAPEHRVAHFGKPPVSTHLRAQLRDAQRRVDDFLSVCLDEITRSEPDIVGFTAMFHQLSASLALAQRVKTALPASCLVMGGASCRGEMGQELLRSFPFLDEVVSGEGEDALAELVRKRGNQQPSSAGTNLDRGSATGKPQAPSPGDGRRLGTDLNTVPYPDYEDYFQRLERSPLAGTFAPRIPFETSRGCWWGEKRRCTFCGQGSQDLAYRQKEPNRAFREIEYLTRKHPGCPVFFTDEVIPTDAFDGFISKLPSRMPELEVVYVELRPTLRRDQMRLLAESGMRRMEVGIESLSSSVLRIMRKGTTALQGVQLLKQAREMGLEVIWNLIWGMPGEDPSEYSRMAEMIPLISHLQPPNTVGPFRLDRFSPIFEDPDTFGLFDVHAYPAYRYIYDLPAESLDRLAYFFTFRYQEPQAVDSYTEALAGRVVEWKNLFPRSVLSYTDDGERLVFSDSRPGRSAEELTVLSGMHRTVYLACEEVITVTRLREVIAETAGREACTDELPETLACLVEEGLILRDGRRYLSLGLLQA